MIREEVLSPLFTSELLETNQLKFKLWMTQKDVKQSVPGSPASKISYLVGNA